MTTPAANPYRTASRRTRWPRALAALFGALLLLLALALAGAWWWSGTEGSLAKAIGWAARSQPLVVEEVTGALRQGGKIGHLAWRDEQGLNVEADDVALAWQPLSLLRRRLSFERFSAASIRIDDQRPPSAPTGPPASLQLPLAITLDEIAIGRIVWAGPPAFEASDVRGRYAYTGTEHQLELANAQVAGGSYQGRVNLGATGELPLKAALAGVLQADVPGSSTRLPLAFDATAEGPLTAMNVKAALRVNGPAARQGLQPQASATARVMPWADQPLPQADASFRDFDAALLWPQAPRTQLTGTASVRPGANEAWLLTVALNNTRPGPWDQQLLPLERLEAAGEWRGRKVLLRSLDARAGDGRLQASGAWTGTTAPNDWTLDASFERINPAALHTQLAGQTVGGRAALRSEGDMIFFDTTLQAVDGAKRQSNVLAPLRLRDAMARGSWQAQGGGTLKLAALRVRTSDAELNASGEFQPQPQSGRGKLALMAPGLQASAEGELQPASGAGQLNVQARDAAQALRWLRSLPGVAQALKDTQAQGRAELRVGWQGGWRDPALNAQFDVPTLDVLAPAAAAEPIQLRAVQASLNGRIGQAQLTLQGRAESGQRRFALQLAAEGGGSGAARGAPPWSATVWQALVQQLNLSVQDPTLGEGAWRALAQRPFTLRWASNTLEAGAGQAALIAPASSNGATPSQAVLAWEATRWRPGEITTAGTLKGLPLAWVELIAGPQLAGAGLAGNLVFDGQWDAVIGPGLRLKAELARSSGDLSLLAETGQGNATRVAAGIREARVSISSEGDSVSAALRWDSERAGTADGQLRTRLQPPGPGQSGWAWPADAPLSGQLRAQLPRIGAWSVLAPPGWRLRGSLATNLTVSGTRAAPQLAGELRADDLALRSVVDGIEFGNGRLRAQLDGTRMRISEFTLQGAGERGTGGMLTAEGEAGWVNGQAQATLNARLDRLRASIRTDRQLNVSGNLQATLSGNQAALTGALRVDQARILLPDEGRPQLGNDVIVRGARGAASGEKAASQAQATPAATAAGKPLAVKIDVALDLGNDFRVEGKGIDTRVRGTLALTGESLAAPRLVGTVSTFGGQYRAYGQRLDVEQGVLRFTGPIDNPALDILAVRPNMTQRVGVQITGTALLPSVRLYAQPELPDAEKLSWLVLGRASASGGAEAALLQQAAVALLGSKSGNTSGGIASRFGLDELSFSGGDGGTSGAAITLGKRFTRNFYAAYERSLSGALGTLSVFYELSQRFTVRGQTGEQTAIDLIYTVPYD